MRTQRGFSLLELIVVLVVLGLLMSLVPPLLSGVGLTTQMRGAARQLAAGMRSARTVAVTRQQEAVLTVDLAQRSFSVSGNPRQISLPSSESVSIKLHTALQEVVNEERSAIRFFPDGSSTGGHVALSDGKLEYRVNVDWLTGRVNIEEREPQP
jgi:general secretion pathway protein H